VFALFFFFFKALNDTLQTVISEIEQGGLEIRSVKKKKYLFKYFRQSTSFIEVENINKVK